ncbi:hypothetical protein JCM3765_003904 [Sporobolomyces pararoseus]
MSRTPSPEPSTIASERSREIASSSAVEEGSKNSRQAEEQQGEQTASRSVEDSTSPSSTTRTTRSSRSQEATQTRRSARRASVDPYPSQPESAEERRRRSTETRARSSQPEHTVAVEEQQPASVDQPMQEISERSSSDEAAESIKGKCFELIVLQQPEIGAEAGLRKVTLGRLPIIPAPVVQLIVKDESGQILDIEMPYLFCACSLHDADGANAVDLAPSNSEDDEELSALIGNIVRNPHRVRDLDGNVISVFVFEDMSVRMQGNFTLEFSLGEARQAQSPKLASVVSEPFGVVEWKNYPGRPAADIVPELSMHLHNQGVPIYIPPLLLSQGPASPPPPSSNPFPVDPSEGIHQDEAQEHIEGEAETAPPPSSSPLWLRDHCREERSYHPATRQRLVDTCKIPADLRPQEVVSDEEGIYVTWPESSFESSYRSFYPWVFLVENSYNPALLCNRELAKKDSSSKILWTSDISNQLPTVTYEEVMQSEEGVFEWLKRIDVYGFSFCSGIPPIPEATEQLIRRIAFIRETHYGGFWDFTANLEHGDLAYSDVRLEAHTDTTYFTDPCGLQLFHLLSPSTSHKGGHNLLVDGFRAASILRSSHPSLYELLSTLPIPAHASGSGSASIPSGVHMKPLKRYPVFNHDENGELVQVRWNGDDRAVVGGEAFAGERMDEWYEALRVWEGILRSDESQLWTRMEMGTAIIFDNIRVLHGRSGYSGERRLCGAYVNGDDYRSRLRGLEKQFGEKSRRDKAIDETLSRYGLSRSTTRAHSGGAWDGFL